MSGRKMTNDHDAEPEPLLSVVIPAYNEADNVARGVLQRTIDFLAVKQFQSELIVVDDGSSDETASLIRKHHPTAKLIASRHEGKAASVRKGMLQATGEYALFMDMDLATPVSHIDDCLAKLMDGYDVVIGSRQLKGSRRVGDPPGRRLAAVIFSMVVRALLLPGIRDTQCGFKAFRHSAAQEIFSQLQVFSPNAQVNGPRVTAFDVELLLLARSRGFRIAEIPISWRHVRTQRVALLSESPRMLGEVLAVWWKYRAGKYNFDSGKRNS